ncbi:MAG: hypothetical protein A4E52_01448 [Pelotomaculum sp. PtaB.Bin013]|uniref:Helix-turn-helix domain containing protein n=1 Tax=Pelotomaculum isophthalicicum JI TaxID=947010 RepID=A0A9X4H736_9FIRM|nr:helix-turn-helix domain-containing protein [Pelotomaculum isophthalicicum]MDF9409059.1 helix-turn-helix domain containing protein [Pelotomaculum isophthalicicum JI]OPX87022.1 MAG: hypothetical protein A4E52_01448 [Pelotomaculum sp. PtaB.Bin013]
METNNTNDATIEILDPLPSPHEGRSPHNKFPEELRQQVVQETLTTRNISKIAEKFSISRQTVSVILREYLGEHKELIDFEFINSIDEVTRKVLTRLKNEIDSIPPSQLVIAAGVLLDKREGLFKGKVTGGNQVLNLRVAWKDAGSGAVELSTGTGQGE